MGARELTMSDAQRICLLAAELGSRLKAQHRRLASAESCTGGGIGYAVTQVAGSSAWFDRGFITYSNEAKVQQLGVPQATLRAHGAVSEAVARAMALGAVTRSAAQVAVAVTGIAGPGGGTRDKPVGTVCFGWVLQGARTSAPCVTTTRQRFSGDRAAVRTQSIIVALEGLIRVLDDYCGEI